MSWKRTPVSERQARRLLPQGLMFIAVDTGFLQTPGEAIARVALQAPELSPDQ